MKTNHNNQIAGIVLSALLLLALLNSGYFFLATLKMGIGKWLAFNACSLAIIVYLVCFVLYRITKKEFLLAVPLLPLYFFGTMGLFTMPWNEANLFAQITHIVITATVVWIITWFLKGRKYEALGKGSLAGILFFVPVIAVVQSYTHAHMDEFLQLLQGL
jgi:hypothetical protein